MFSLPSLPASQIKKKTTEKDAAEVNAPSIKSGSTSEDKSSLSGIEKEKVNSTPVAPNLNYTVPEWSGLPLSEYSFDIIKNGTLISSFQISKESLVCGKE